MENDKSVCFNGNESSCPEWISLESFLTQICQDPMIITLSAVNELLSTELTQSFNGPPEQPSPSFPTSSGRPSPTPCTVSVPYQDEYVFEPSNTTKSLEDSDIHHELTAVTESSALNCLANGTPPKMNGKSKPAEDESALSSIGFLDDHHQSNKESSPTSEDDDLTLSFAELFPSKYLMPVTRKKAQLSPDIQSLPRRFDYDDYSLPLMELSPYKYLYQ
ncbi:uncharacterized protein LOC135215246 [Macrobrachium nipponense]|uniref:uncharacterized protein LOC135215246 n=1 Tax=Macrobrachium nipponense TaxID=159736 RepID=UPI0030C7FE19